MCGISGIVGVCDDTNRGELEGALALLRHRGPDAQGSFGSGLGAIGQTRLAVIDLETGDPPITDESGQIGVALNGEIYNFRQLRDQLEALGHRLRSRGDTEVIAHLAEELDGPELASALDGMFSFAVWDERRSRLLLARDRLGKKPLYYWHGDGRLAFGSEIKAVLAYPAVPRRLNARAIPAYLTFGYVPTPETFFDGILSVPPGHVLTFEPGGEPALQRYWSLPVPGLNGTTTVDMSLTDAAREVRSLLESAIERRMVADVPLGAFLSGGIDSSAIVALLSGLTSDPVRTFTIGFDDPHAVDERPFAQLVARRFRTDHSEHVVRAQRAELIERLLWHHDQPFGDSSALPTYLVSEVTRQQVTVALSGDGGDELFGGYERFAGALLLDRYRQLPSPVRVLVRGGLHALDPALVAGRVETAQRFTAHAELPMLDAYRSWLSFMPEKERSRALPEPDGWALRAYNAVWERSRDADVLTRLLDLNINTYLLDDLLVKADRMSMAHGLEVRSPFLDTALIEFVARLPAVLKVRGLASKRVLRAAVADLLPKQVLTRRKRGFALPLDGWFRRELKPLLDGRLGVCDAHVKRHLRAEVVDELLAEHESGRRNRGQALWMLLTLELFLRREDW